MTEAQDQERAAPASARTTAPKAIPSLDEVIKSFKNTGYYKSVAKKTQAPAAPRVNSMERNKNVGFLSKVKARSSVRLESRHVPTFQHENFTHRREEEARKLLGDESHQSETKPAASKKKSVETLFKSFEKKQLRDGLHSQSMTILPHVTSANNRLERITKLKVGAAAGDKPNVESQVRKFQEDFELIKNHVRRKQEEQNPLIRDIEKEKELIRVARLEMNSLLFKMERQRKQELLEQEKQSERELAEFRQKQRLKSIMVDSERYLKEKAERVMYNKAQFEEKRFIKDKINKILKNQFEEEQKLIVGCV